MNFLKSLGGLVGSGAATGGLPYVIDAPGASGGGGGGGGGGSTGAGGYELPDFQLFAGHSKTDAAHAVSIFKSRQPATQPTLNALRRIKTLRHPNVLAFVDGTEMPNNGPIILVTEPVVPLGQYLEDLRRQCGGPESEAFQMSVAWGLRSVLLALQFINVDCKLLHGRVNPTSIFVTKGGDWKLGGFELTGELTADGPSYVYTAFEQFADANYKSPECQRREWRAIGQSPPYAVDIWAFAGLLYFVFNDSRIHATDLSAATNIPHALRMQYRKSVEADPRRRPSPDKFLASGYFDTPFIKRMDFLENLAVKTPEEKVEFYKDLGSNLSSLPQAFGVHKVLPALKAVVEFGAATATKNGPVKLDPSASHMLPAMVQIGSSLSADEFKEQVLPIIVKLFSCNDRAVRVQLLQMMEKFAVHFDAKLVNSPVIFDNLCSGFTDAAPVLRELTVKSMLHIADKLSDSNLNTRVMKYFAKLQTDPEPAIRTNTTICLGRIASKLSESTRPKVLFPAFSRAMRDPFPHARLAGLRSLTACEEFFSPQGIASSIIPAIAPLLLDVSVSVREQASVSMDLFMKKVMEEAVQMKVREEQQAQEQKLKQEAGVSNEPDANASSAPNSGGGYASSLTSWAASTVSSNVNRIVGSGSSGAPVTTATPQNLTSNQSSSIATSIPSQSASTAFTADDFGDDGWGEDDDLDGLGSPKQPVQTAPTLSSSVVSTGAMKLNVSRPPPQNASSTFDVADDAGWGDDNWGGDDDLMKKLGSDARSLSVSTQRTGSFGNAGITTTNRTSSFSSATSGLATSSTRMNSSTVSAPRKTVSERMAEAKAKREPLGAMKLETKKAGDEWDNWDF